MGEASHPGRRGKGKLDKPFGKTFSSKRYHSHLLNTTISPPPPSSLLSPTPQTPPPSGLPPQSFPSPAAHPVMEGRPQAGPRSLDSRHTWRCTAPGCCMAKSPTSGWQIVRSKFAWFAPASSLPGLDHPVPDAFRLQQPCIPVLGTTLTSRRATPERSLSSRVPLRTHIPKAAEEGVAHRVPEIGKERTYFKRMWVNDSLSRTPLSRNPPRCWIIWVSQRSAERLIGQALRISTSTKRK